MPITLATTVWEVRTTGSDTNGGGYVSGGTDWSQQNSAQYSVTDAVTTAGNGTITSATANFGTDVVGNVCYLQGGTGSIAANRYNITARNSSTSITVSSSTGISTGTGATLRIGGALASIGELGSRMLGQNTAWIRSGTYTITTATANVSTGTINYPSGNFDNPTRFVGYGSTRGDNGTKPILLLGSGVSGATIIGTSSNAIYVSITNLEFNGNSQTTSRGVFYWTTADITDCNFRNFTNSAIVGGAPGFIRRVYATGCSGSSGVISASSGNVLESTVESNTTFGIQAGTIADCIARNNSGATSDGFRPATGATIRRCTSHGNGRSGIYIVNTNDTGLLFQDCLLTNNGAWGVGGDRSNNLVQLINIATRDNTSGAIQRTWTTSNLIALTADPYIDAASGDFRLNNTAGGGALLRSQPFTFPGLSTISYPDIGATQAQSEASVSAGIAFFGGLG